MKKKTMFPSLPRQLLKPIWCRTESACGNWLSHWENWRVSNMDAPDSIPSGSTKWSISYVEDGIEIGQASETLHHREGFY